MNPVAAFWGGLPRWLQQTMAFVGLFLLALVFGRIWLEAHDMQVRNKEQDKIKKRELEQEIKLREQAKETIHEIDTRLADADKAVARYPGFASSRELRDADPDLAGLILEDPVGDHH